MKKLKDIWAIIAFKLTMLKVDLIEFHLLRIEKIQTARLYNTQGELFFVGILKDNPTKLHPKAMRVERIIYTTEPNIVVGELFAEVTKLPRKSSFNA